MSKKIKDIGGGGGKGFNSNISPVKHSWMHFFIRAYCSRSKAVGFNWSFGGCMASKKSITECSRVLQRSTLSRRNSTALSNQLVRGLCAITEWVSCIFIHENVTDIWCIVLCHRTVFVVQLTKVVLFFGFAGGDRQQCIAIVLALESWI